MNSVSPDNSNVPPTEATPIESNPYAAPAVIEDESLLADDIDFLISDVCLLVRESADLPKICIASGRKTELIFVQSTLTCKPRRFGGATLSVILPCIVFLVAVAAAGVRGANGFVAVAALLLFATAVWVVKAKLAKTIEVSFWVSSQSEEDAWHRALGYRILIGTSVIGMIISGIAGYSFDSNFYAFIPLLVVFGLIIGPRCYGRIQPYYFGKHKGLNILGGFHSKFLSEVRRMAEDIEEQGTVS